MGRLKPASREASTFFEPRKEAPGLLNSTMFQHAPVFSFGLTAGREQRSRITRFTAPSRTLHKEISQRTVMRGRVC